MPSSSATTSGGGVRSLRTGANLPLGLDDAPLEGEADQLGSGELLMIYSDGLSEQADGAGKMLGMDGLREQIRAIRAACDGGADALADRLSAFLAERQGGRAPEDDQSYPLARRL